MNALMLGPLGLSSWDYLSLFLHFAVLSLLAIGGAVTTVPDMHRYVVGQRGWLDDATFSASVALAQAAPGPNVLFVAVIGFNVGGFAGVAATLVGALLPSTLLTLTAARWSDGRREQRGVRAFTEGMAPVTIGLLLATSWILTEPTRASPMGWLLFGVTAVWMVRTKWSPLWPIAAGAAAGALGWV